MSDESVAMQRNERYSKRRFNADALPPRLAASGAPLDTMPTRAGYRVWGAYLLPELGVDPSGWWYAVCPLHGNLDSAEPSALMSFPLGVMRCLADPPCHEQRESGRMKSTRTLNSTHLELLKRGKEVVLSAETD